MIIIIGRESDVHIKKVCEYLNDYQYNIIDFSKFGVDWFSGFLSFSSEILLEETNLTSFSNVKKVWFRRPKKPDIQLKASEKMKEYIIEESITYLKSLPYISSWQWINDPHSVEKASRKPYQLYLAKKLGFLTPKTFFGNSPKSLSIFFKVIKEEYVVIKALDSSYIELEETESAIYAKKITVKNLKNNLNSIMDCPIIIQQAFLEKRDIRVTVVGNKVFSAEIKIPNNEKVDWRESGKNAFYIKHILPDKILNLCFNITNQLGLNINCIDLVLDKEGDYYFLEANPLGQWLAVEEMTGMKISASIADLLTT